MRISDWSSDVCSSDLPAATAGQAVQAGGTGAHRHGGDAGRSETHQAGRPFGRSVKAAIPRVYRHSEDGEPKMVIFSDPARSLLKVRSEEHTSELQSLMRISYAVFCLKKKKTIKKQHIPQHENPN